MMASGRTGSGPDRGGAPSALSELLSQWVDRRGWHESLHDSQIHQRWLEIAGDEVAAHAEPVRLRGGVLVVRAQSGAWATQLRYLAPRLLERAQQVLGSDRVHRVQVVSGEGTQRSADEDR